MIAKSHEIFARFAADGRTEVQGVARRACIRVFAVLGLDLGSLPERSPLRFAAVGEAQASSIGV
jgi:hypothetical protein